MPNINGFPHLVCRSFTRLHVAVLLGVFVCATQQDVVAADRFATSRFMPGSESVSTSFEIRRLPTIPATRSDRQSGERLDGKLDGAMRLGSANHRSERSFGKVIHAVHMRRAAAPGAMDRHAIVDRAAYAEEFRAAGSRVRQTADKDDGVVAPLPTIKPIRDIELSVGDHGEVTPPDYAKRWFEQHPTVHHPTGTSRAWPNVQHSWTAPALGYHPLYFEEVNLERYGYTCGMLQPAVSTAHFFGNVMALPYHVVQSPLHECIYSLGYERPGSCASYYHRRLLPLDAHAAAVEAATVAGLILLLP